MRVALVGPTYPFRGGIAQYTASLYRALLNSGHEALSVSFRRLYPSLFFPGTTQLDTSQCPNRIPTEELLDSVSPRSWRAAADRLIDFDPDCALIQWWHPFFAPAYWVMSRRFRRRRQGAVIFLCHNVYPHERPGLPGSTTALRLMARAAFFQADGFLVHSKQLAREVRSLQPEAELERIFHPIHDFCPSREKAASAETSSDGVARLLFFGNIRPYKGLEVFIRALALVRRQIRVQAVVAGEFYMDSRPVKELAADLGLGDDVLWSDGYVENEQVPRYFGQADLMVLPYIEATQSGVVPLAYGFGLPVVASDVGGLSEVVVDGQTGYLVQPGQPEVLAAKILEYLGLPREKKEQFSRNIREFRQRLSWEQVVEKLVEVTTRAKGQRKESVRRSRQ
jgi:glycosyltransferase involved in cell wall biosynthesis